MNKTERKRAHIITVLTEKGFKETSPSVFEKDGVIVSLIVQDISHCYLRIKIIDELNDFAFQTECPISMIDIL